MIVGGPYGPKASDICLTGEENPEKTSPRKLFPTGDGTGARCVTGAHMLPATVVNDRSSNVQNADLTLQISLRPVFTTSGY